MLETGTLISLCIVIESKKFKFRTSEKQTSPAIFPCICNVPYTRYYYNFILLVPIFSFSFQDQRIRTIPSCYFYTLPISRPGSKPSGVRTFLSFHLGKYDMVRWIWKLNISDCVCRREMKQTSALLNQHFLWQFFFHPFLGLSKTYITLPWNPLLSLTFWRSRLYGCHFLLNLSNDVRQNDVANKYLK